MASDQEGKITAKGVETQRKILLMLKLKTRQRGHGIVFFVSLFMFKVETPPFGVSQARLPGGQL
ncbi:MAG: hypothetical protein ABFR97_11170 [Thermodesulfobacteriota bacterium]